MKVVTIVASSESSHTRRPDLDIGSVEVST
jgi:hypothetical protein